MDNRIYRSRETKMLAGVCGGIAEMYNLDPTLVRLITAALVLFSGFTFLLVYVMCAIIIPLEPSPGYILKRHQRPSEPTPSQDRTPLQTETEQPVKAQAPVQEQRPAEQPQAGPEATNEANVAETTSGDNDLTRIDTDSDRY